MQAPYAERRARYDWLVSQARWHALYPGRWHRGQERWYYNQASGLLSFTELLTETFQKHTKAIAANVTQNNTLFRLLTNPGSGSS